MGKNNKKAQKRKLEPTAVDKNSVKKAKKTQIPAAVIVQKKKNKKVVSFLNKKNFLGESLETRWITHYFKVTEQEDDQIELPARIGENKKKLAKIVTKKNQVPKGKKKVVAKAEEIVDEEEQEEDPASENEVSDVEEDAEGDSAEESDEGESDEESGTSGDFMKETGEKLDFDFEAFPLEDRDKDGVGNMLTQIFLRADVDVNSLASALIDNAPTGCVIGPAEDVDDEDNTTSNVVYGLISFLPKIDREQKWVKDVTSLLLARASKNAESRTTLQYRVVENEAEVKPAPASNVGKKQKKMGKAEKKRLAAAALAEKDVEFENEEDGLLEHLQTGSSISFDYPVHADVDPGSKFHIIKKGTITKTPYRRATIMDTTRFKSFLQTVATSRHLS